MSQGHHTRFAKGRSGNPAGRPTKAPAHAPSAFNVILDQVLTVSRDGEMRELTVDEALQLQTYKDALSGKRLAVRKILKMIQAREEARAKLSPAPAPPVTVTYDHEADNANEAMAILGISDAGTRKDEVLSCTPLRLQTWVTQAAISRPGRRSGAERDDKAISRSTVEPERLVWPRSRGR